MRLEADPSSTLGVRVCGGDLSRDGVHLLLGLFEGNSVCETSDDAEVVIATTDLRRDTHCRQEVVRHGRCDHAFWFTAGLHNSAGSPEKARAEEGETVAPFAKVDVVEGRGRVVATAVRHRRDPNQAIRLRIWQRSEHDTVEGAEHDSDRSDADRKDQNRGDGVAVFWWAHRFVERHGDGFFGLRARMFTRMRDALQI